MKKSWFFKSKTIKKKNSILMCLFLKNKSANLLDWQNGWIQIPRLFVLVKLLFYPFFSKFSDLQLSSTFEGKSPVFPTKVDGHPTYKIPFFPSPLFPHLKSCVILEGRGRWREKGLSKRTKEYSGNSGKGWKAQAGKRIFPQEFYLFFRIWRLYLQKAPKPNILLKVTSFMNTSKTIPQKLMMKTHFFF